MPVDGGVQVGIASAVALLGAIGGLHFRTVPPVNAPSASIGNAANLLHVDVGHVTRVRCDDLLRLPVALPARVNEASTIQPELAEEARDGASTDVDLPAVEFECDARCRPLVFAAHFFDLRHHVAGSRGGFPIWLR